MSTSLPVPQLLEAIQSIRYTAYVDVSTFAILIYDYVITFGQEKELIWSMPLKSPAKGLFFLTRYLPFVDTSMVLWRHFADQPSNNSCLFTEQASAWLLTVGFVLAEVILTLRTWAVWERRRSIGIGLIIFYATVWTSAFAVTGVFSRSLIVAPLPKQVPGCLVAGGSSIIIVDWILLIVYEAVILALMVIQAVKKYKTQGNSALYRTVYRDGSLFYLYLFVLSGANILAIVALPSGMQLILTNFERVIHSVTTGRILLSLRSMSKREDAVDSFPAEDSFHSKTISSSSSNSWQLSALNH